MKTLIIILVCICSFSITHSQEIECEPKPQVIIYCHCGFGTPSAFLTRDIRFYVRSGFPVYAPLFSDEIGEIPVASQDIEIIRDLAIELIGQGYDVNLVGISLGGFRALSTFLRYPELFRKAVIMMAPINVDGLEDMEEWAKTHTVEELEMAMTFFLELQNPIELAQLGYAEGLAERMLLIWGGRDTVCPAEDCYLFSELTGSECIIFERNRHNVSGNRKALKLAIEFLKGE